MAEGDAQGSGQSSSSKTADGDPQGSGSSSSKTADGDPQGSGSNPSNSNMPEEDSRNTQRVFKKTSSNNMITLYVACRDLVLEANRTQRVEGVLLIDPEFAYNKEIYGQVIVIFRYGREDEEIMGLQFFNESLVTMLRIWPACQSQRKNAIPLTPLQETLIKRLGPNAIPFYLEIYNKAPPTVVLSPTKPYNGQPVGTSYDVRIFTDEEPKGKESRPILLRMGIRVIYGASRIDTAPLLTPSPSNESFRVKPRYQRFNIRRRPRARVVEEPADPVTEDESAQNDNKIENGENIKSKEQRNNQRNAINEHREQRNAMERSENEGEITRAEERSYNNDEIQNEEISVETESAIPLAPRPAPRVKVEKSFLLSDGKLHLESWLNKSSYHHGEKVVVNFRIVNDSRKTVNRIKACVIQFVDVCMFDNGKFKNKVAMAKDSCYTVPPGQRFQDYYTLRPRRVVTKNWIALESTVSYPEGCLASTVICHPEDAKCRSLNSIFVSYYVKVTLAINKLGGELSLKLPFSLSHAPHNYSPPDSTTTESAIRTYMDEGGGSAEGNGGSVEKNGMKDDVEDREKDDRTKNDKEDDGKQENNQEENVDNNDKKESVKDGNDPIGNQVSNSEVDPERRQYVSADVSVNIIENQLYDGSHFEELPLVRAPKLDQEKSSPIVQYLETNI